MSFITFDLNKTPLGRTYSVSFIISAMVLGPYWHIYDFHPHLFHKLDLLKLLLLCLSIAVPALLMLGGLYGFITSKKRGDSERTDAEKMSFIMRLLFDGAFSFIIACALPSVIFFLVGGIPYDIMPENAVAIIGIFFSVAGGFAEVFEDWLNRLGKRKAAKTAANFQSPISPDSDTQKKS